MPHLSQAPAFPTILRLSRPPGLFQGLCSSKAGLPQGSHLLSKVSHRLDYRSSTSSWRILKSGGFKALQPQSPSIPGSERQGKKKSGLSSSDFRTHTRQTFWGTFKKERRLQDEPRIGTTACRLLGAHSVLGSLQINITCPLSKNARSLFFQKSALPARPVSCAWNTKT